MTKVITKSSVRIEEFTPEILYMVSKLVFSDLGEHFHKEIIVITSIHDGKRFDVTGRLISTAHKENSKHYVGKAVDIRSRNCADVDAFISAYQSSLGENFSVLFEGKGTENEHFHVQTKKGIEVQINEAGGFSVSQTVAA